MPEENLKHHAEDKLSGDFGRKKRRLRSRELKAAPSKKPEFRSDETVMPELTIRQQYRAFRENGLGIIDSFFNALYIVACEKAVERERQKGKSSDLMALETRFLRLLAAVPQKVRGFFGLFALPFRKKENVLHYQRKRDFLRAHLAHFAVAAVAVFAAIYAYVTLSRPIVLDVDIEGKYIGTVENQAEVQLAVRELENNVETILGSDFKFPYPIHYALSPRKGKAPLSDKNAVSNVLYTYVREYICTAGGLYLDGTLVAVAENQETVESVLERLIAEKIEETQDPSTVIFNEVRIVTQAYPTASILDEEALYQFLKTLTLPAEERQSATDFSEIWQENQPEESVAVLANGTLFADTQLASANVSRKRSNQPQNTDHLQLLFCIKETVVYEAEIPYQIEYQESKILYTSMANAVTRGVPGRERIEAEIYWVDGKEARRDIIKQTTLSEPVTEVIAIGIKVLPEDLGITERKGSFILPNVVPLFSGYGEREDGFHHGWDLPGKEGDNIYAAASGVVVGVSGPEGQETYYPDRGFIGYGYFVLLRHDEDYMTVYAHCSKICVELGQAVKQGDKIAEVGSTGLSEGPHCHFEIMKNFTRLNPANGYMYEGDVTIYDNPKQTEDPPISTKSVSFQKFLPPLYAGPVDFDLKRNIPKSKSLFGILFLFL